MSNIVLTKPFTAVNLPFAVIVSVFALPNTVLPSTVKLVLTFKLSSTVTSPELLRILFPAVSNLSPSFKSPPDAPIIP